MFTSGSEITIVSSSVGKVQADHCNLRDKTSNHVSREMVNSKVQSRQGNVIEPRLNRLDVNKSSYGVAIVTSLEL